jgi:histidinol-phosphate phosphatase family protein
MDKAFFLDKDGTLVDNSEYPEVIPMDKLLTNEIIDGLKLMQGKGYKLFIVSNQPWISRGIFSYEEIQKKFESVINQLESLGIIIQDYLFCPHQNSDNCNCRKPSPGMILDLAKKHKIDLNNSFMIGDTDKDITAGEKAGVKTALVLTGDGKKFENIVKPTYILKNLNEIKKII